MHSHADRKSDFSIRNSSREETYWKVIATGIVRSDGSTGTRFHGDDPLNWSFRDVEESQSWPLARQIAAEIRADDCPQANRSKSRAFLLSSETIGRAKARKRRHEIEKGRSARSAFAGIRQGDRQKAWGKARAERRVLILSRRRHGETDDFLSRRCLAVTALRRTQLRRGAGNRASLPCACVRGYSRTAR